METKRRYDIDWLRVLAFYLLILYHTGMLFVPWEFHIKNNSTSEWFESWMVFLSNWRLPLLFIISGIGVSYSLNNRTGSQFLLERTKRLLVPLIFGMLVIIPPQIYIERVSKGAYYGSYFEFWKTVFSFIPYPKGGSLSWHHLWYVLYIFVFSILMLPLFRYLRSNKSLQFRKKLSTLIRDRPIVLYLILLIPIFLVRLFLVRLYPTTHALVGDWYNLLFTLCFFIFGYLLTLIDSVWEVIAAKRKLSLITALIPIIFCELFLWGPTYSIMNEDTELFFHFYGVIKSVIIVSWLFAVLGYARIYLNKTNKFLRYANESVYPLYILHQSVELVIAFYIIHLDWPILPKFILVTIGTFGISILIYEIFIRRFNFMRILFGLKPVPVSIQSSVHVAGNSSTP
ncbi:MAG: acyltransferase family protein [Syntrophothermus sp.]